MRIKSFIKNSINVKQLFKFLGPAFIVSVAYIDPGNFATNIAGGSAYNYTLLWVILVSNLMAIFLQNMSAKLGIATGFNLPQMCGRIFSKKMNWFFFIAAELAAMATNLAEFIGGTLGFHLLFKIPMLYSGMIVVVLSFLIVYLGKYGQKVEEFVIILLVGTICVAYTIELFLANPDWKMVGYHLFVPCIPTKDALLIAVGILGATVMPHVIYLHSQLVQCRNIGHIFKKKCHFKMEKIDIFIAMNIAFIVNTAMLIVSAAVFYKNQLCVTNIEEAHYSLSPLLGNLSSSAFGVALIASGLSSAAVGTMAGQTIMQGFVGIKISDNLTRIITMFPGMLIMAVGIEPMRALIFSQVILSFVLPMAIIPMLIITSKSELMGELVNNKITSILGWIIASIIIFFNMVLLFLL